MNERGGFGQNENAGKGEKRGGDSLQTFKTFSLKRDIFYVGSSKSVDFTLINGLNKFLLVLYVVKTQIANIKS